MGTMSRVSPYHRTSSTKKKHQDSKFFDFPSPLATDDSFHIVDSVTDHHEDILFPRVLILHRTKEPWVWVAVKVEATGNYYSIFTEMEDVGQRACS